MVNILKNPQRRSRLGRNGHDLSFRRTFSHSCGQLLPVMWDILNPNESIRINDNLFTRTQPLATPAFIRATEHIYYFFVPMCQIDPYFDNAFYGIKDFINTNDLDFSGRGTNKETPIVSQSILLSNIKTGIFQNFITGDSDTEGYFIHKDGGTQYLCLASGKGAFDNTFFGLVGLDEYGIPTLWNVMRLLDMLDYGVDLFQHVCSSDIASDTNPQSCNFSIDVHRLQAYQKIWFDYFRNSTYSPNNPWAYNCGYAMKGSGTNGWQYDYSTLYNSNYNGLFKLRYHPLKKDFFTCIQPTPLFDVNDDVTGYNSTVPQGGLNSYVLSAYGVQLQGMSSMQSLFKNYNFGVTSSGEGSLYDENESVGVDMRPLFQKNTISSLQQLRLMYAYDKLLQITQRAGKHVDDQTEAHFGVRPPKGMSGEVIYLGSHSSRLNIGEIAATAAGSNGSANTMEATSSLGELAGRGLGMSGRNRTINYKTNCHGILMAVYALVPDVDYFSTGTDRRSLWRSIMDYPRPEFDNLGMQPLYRFQLMNTFYTEYDSVVTSARADTIIGWQYRWMEEKLSYDRVNGGFNYNLRNWTAATMPFYFGRDLASGFYCSPCFFDSVFAMTFNPYAPQLKTGNDTYYIYLSQLPSGTFTTGLECPVNGSICYSRDNFLTSIDFDYKKSSWLSLFSLPIR